MNIFHSILTILRLFVRDMMVITLVAVTLVVWQASFVVGASVLLSVATVLLLFRFVAFASLVTGARRSFAFIVSIHREILCGIIAGYLLWLWSGSWIGAIVAWPAVIGVLFLAVRSHGDTSWGTMIRNRRREHILMIIAAVLLVVWHIEILFSVFLMIVLGHVLYRIDFRMLIVIGLIVLFLSPFVTLSGHAFFAERMAEYVYAFLLFGTVGEAIARYRVRTVSHQKA